MSLVVSNGPLDGFPEHVISSPNKDSFLLKGGGVQHQSKFFFYDWKIKESLLDHRVLCQNNLRNIKKHDEHRPSLENHFRGLGSGVCNLCAYKGSGLTVRNSVRLLRTYGRHNYMQIN
jgi:hypothetical protein